MLALRIDRTPSAQVGVGSPFRLAPWPWALWGVVQKRTSADPGPPPEPYGGTAVPNAAEAPSSQEGSAPRYAPALGCGVGRQGGSSGFVLDVRRVCAGSVRCTGSLSGARAHTLGPVTGRPRPSLSTSCEPRGRRPAHTPWRIGRVTPAHTPAHSPTRTTPRHWVLAGRHMKSTMQDGGGSDPS